MLAIGVVLGVYKELEKPVRSPILTHIEKGMGAHVTFFLALPTW
jgi:hypothetical protein